MSLMVNLLTALSLGVCLPQLTQTMALTYPLLYLLRPLFLLFFGIYGDLLNQIIISKIN